MKDFCGFSPETTDFLVGIRLNNEKGWYNEHKHIYQRAVKEPMAKLSNLVYEGMREFDKDFDAAPRVSRINRDTRFSKDKGPYKHCAWFFLRTDQTISIQHEKPSYFFEVSPDWFRYGFGYCPPNATGIRLLRNKMNSFPDQTQRLVEWLNQESGFTTEGERYKKPVPGGNTPEISDWFQRKEFVIVKYGEHNSIFYKPELCEKIIKDFIALYPLYRYFYEL